MSKQKVGITSVPKIETNSMIRFTSAASVLLSIGVMKPLNIQNNIEDNTSFEFNNSEEFVSLKNLKGSSAQALLPPGFQYDDGKLFACSTTRLLELPSGAEPLAVLSAKKIARNFLKQKERTDDLNKLLTIEDNWDFDYISYQITKKGKFKIYTADRADPAEILNFSEAKQLASLYGKVYPFVRGDENIIIFRISDAKYNYIKYCIFHPDYNRGLPKTVFIRKILKRALLKQIAEMQIAGFKGADVVDN